MDPQNFLGDEPWSTIRDDVHVRTRRFARAPGSALGGSLHELAPGSPGFPLHMHYGAEEMFFVVSGRPTLRDGTSERELAPGDVVHCPEGRAGLHAFANRTEEPARILAVSAGRYPDVVAYPEQGVGWVATRDPDVPVADGDDPGIIARYGLPAHE